MSVQSMEFFFPVTSTYSFFKQKLQSSSKFGGRKWEVAGKFIGELCNVESGFSFSLLQTALVPSSKKKELFVYLQSFCAQFRRGRGQIAKLGMINILTFSEI